MEREGEAPRFGEGVGDASCAGVARLGLGTVQQVVVCVLACLVVVGSGAVVTDENTCQRVGAPRSVLDVQGLGCDWHRNVLETRAGNQSCEPSQKWLNASGMFAWFEERVTEEDHSLFTSECTGDDAEGDVHTCEYSENVKCLFDDLCYTPPLQVLRAFVETLVSTFPELLHLIEEIPATCAAIQDNVTCVSKEGCSWNPTNLSRTKRGAEDEVQVISVVHSGGVGAQVAQVQKVSVKAAPYDPGNLTISLVAADLTTLNKTASWFKLSYMDQVTAEISIGASETDIRTALDDLSVALPDYTVHNATSSDDGSTTSWQVRFADNTEATANNLALNTYSLSEVSGAARTESDRVVLTRHARNEQQVTLWSKGPVVGGDFKLSFGDTQTSSLPFNATESQVRIALQALEEDGKPMFEFVAVTTPPPEPEPAPDDPNYTAVQQWRVVFTNQVEEYEVGQRLLVPLYFRGNESQACTECEDFQLEAQAPEDTLVAFMSTESIVKAPKVTGHLRIAPCSFSRPLQGIARPKNGSKLVEFDVDGSNNESIASPGTYIRLSGIVAQVESSTHESILLTAPFQGTLVQDTLDYMRAYECIPSQVMTDYIPVSVTATAEELKTYLDYFIRSYGVAVSPSSEEEDKLNQREWLVTFSQSPNSLDPLITTFEEDEPLGWSIQTEPVSYGTPLTSGYFRIGFAGYNSTEQDIQDALSLYDLELPGPETNTGYITAQGVPTTVAYTRPIYTAATAENVQVALESLPNIVNNSIAVKRVDADLGEKYQNQSAIEINYSWEIVILASSLAEYAEETKKLDGAAAEARFIIEGPNVPTFFVFDESQLKGSQSQIIIETTVEGSGNLSQAGAIEYAEDEEEGLNSPCMANLTYRDERILAFNIEETKLAALHELDANLARCATGIRPGEVWNSRSDCGLVRFSSSLDAIDLTDDATGGGSDEDDDTESDGEKVTTTEPFCVWRETSTIVGNLPEHVDPDQVEEFNWENSTYRGTRGLTRHADCTVPLIYQSQQLLKLFGVSEEFIQAYMAQNETTRPVVDVVLNTNTSMLLSTLIEQFNQCYEDPLVVIQLPAPKFVKIWQQIVIFTCYTVSIWYAFVAAFFAYRMRKLRVLSPKSVGSAILIVSLGIFLGFILGFILGCIPAACVANIYSSIPYNLPGGSAASLGVAQGLLFLYFDLGRGMGIREAN